MRLTRSVTAFVGGALLLALPALPQGLPTGTLSGHAVSGEKQALPGVTVTVSSPALQGVRTTVTNANGDFLVALLPPGDYQVTFEIEGFQKVQRSVRVAAAQTANLEQVEMTLGGVSETIVVTGSAETISSSPQASTTFTETYVEKLPTTRALEESVMLTPGVNDAGPHIAGRSAGSNNGAITISGGQSYENLFLINGVVVNENIRGQALPLYIEDAVQETTTSTSAISAEYGRFAGGVVNVITKSGGNSIHGSFRTNFNNDSWAALNPQIANRIDSANERYEATLGGWLYKDHVWYFGAGRQFTTNLSDQTVATHIPYGVDTNEKRGEGKLTLSPSEGQRLVGSYGKIEHDETGDHFQPVYDVASLVHRQLPQQLLAFDYSGVYARDFYAEAQYSQRKFTFQNDGSTFTDLTRGTLLVDLPTGNRYNSPTFCGVCNPEKRDNNDILVKGSWFLSRPRFGSHDVTFGYDTFKDDRNADNHQSGSDFRMYTSNTIVRGADVFPVFNTGQGFIQWNPIAVLSRGTNFRTNSVFANDRWRFTDALSFNVGLRWDQNDGVDSQGQKVAKDSKVAPRLAAVYDVKKDGDLLVNAAYNVYTTGLANSEGDSTSAAGNPATYRWTYGGPAINNNPNAASLVTPGDAINQVFAWFNSVGGTNNRSFLVLTQIPGGNVRIQNSLASPSTDEYTVGASKRVGSHGFARVDYVHRKWNDFYASVTNLSTGKTVTPTGATVDLTFLTNSGSAANRQYDGIHSQFQYRALERLNVGALYALSWTRGNFDGETSANGPVSSTVLQYPEYKQRSWNSPDGYLATDQRHRLRLWGIYDLWKNAHDSLSFGLLQSYYSGTPYGAVGSVDPRKFVTNPGYAIPPSTVTYYYTARDAFRTAPIVSTDLTATYGFHWAAFSKDIEVFLEPQVLNVFNRKGVDNVNNAVLDTTNTRGFAPFNPFTQKPVEGAPNVQNPTANWQRNPATFGKAQTQFDYQTPRTFRFSVGLRF